MGIGQGLTLAGADDGVLANCHGIALDVFGDAFGGTRLELESEGFS